MSQDKMAQKEKNPDPHSVEAMERLILSEGRYPLDAFAFLQDGLSAAVKRVHGGEDRAEEPGQRHVSGAQLCEALRDLAIERWGLLAPTVLHRWRIRCTLDFGRMVYFLIQHGYMLKTDEDSLEDFRDVYDFEAAFRVAGPFELKDRPNG